MVTNLCVEKCVFPSQFVFYQLPLTIFPKISKQPHAKYSWVFVSALVLRQLSP